MYLIEHTFSANIQGHPLQIYRVIKMEVTLVLRYRSMTTFLILVNRFSPTSIIGLKSRCCLLNLLTGKVSADGYVDLYLQAAFEPERSIHYFIELKYAKANVTDTMLDTLERKGTQAMRTYLNSPMAANLSNLRAYVLVFRKNTCARKIRC